MARGLFKLSSVGVQNLKKPGRYGDGGGLWLQVRSAKHKSWLFRYALHGENHAMGLGALHTISLAEARDRAANCRKLLMNGIDPIKERIALQEQARLQEANRKTFAQCAEDYIEAHQASWKSEKHSKQWMSSLEAYAYPVLASLPIADVNAALILRVLKPIWYTKTETAARVRGRIESILDWATVQGYREGENPAQWKGRLDKLLPAKNKVQQVKHHSALSYAEIEFFMPQLHCCGGIAARALEFAILTVARSSEVRDATWDEIDFNKKLWIISAKRMKAGKEHRVPLADEAIRLLHSLNVLQDSAFIFTAPHANRPLSNMSMIAVLKRMGYKDLTQHGFRSTFRDWAAETTAYPREVIEHALAHQLKNKVEAAYQRGDLLVKRTALMADWAKYCFDKIPYVDEDKKQENTHSR